MAEIGSTWVSVAPNAKGFGKSLNDQVQKESKGLDFGAALGGAFKGAGLAVGAAAGAVALGVGSIVASGVKFNAAMETYQAAFTPLLGGADQAKAKLAELSTFAAKTPFEMTDLAEASQTMLGFGESAQNLMPDLKMLGDISQGNSESLKGLARVFGQVQSTGHLMGDDLGQMIDNGFNPLTIIAAKTGESMTELKTRMSEGKISFQEVSDAMKTATTPSIAELKDQLAAGTITQDQFNESMKFASATAGMYAGSMDKMSQTLTGQWSSLQDGFNTLSGSIVGALSPALTAAMGPLNDMLSGLVGLVQGAPGAQAAVTDASTRLVDAMGNLGPGIEALAANIGTVFTALAPALQSAIQTLVQSLGALLPSILSIASGLILALVGGLIAAAPDLVAAAVPIIMSLIGSLAQMLPDLVDAGIDVLLALVRGITESLPTVLPQVVDGLMRALTELLSEDALNGLLGAALGLIMGLAMGLIQALPSLVAALPAIILGIVNFLVEAIPQLVTAGVDLLVSLIDALPQIIDTIVSALPTIIVAIVVGLLGAIPQIVKAGITLLVSLIKNLPTIIIKIVEAVPEIIRGLVDAFKDPATLKQMGDAGKQIIQGLIDGVGAMGSALWDAAKKLGNKFMDSIKNVFGIHSPSREMRRLGVFTGQGFEDGTVESLTAAGTAASAVMDDVMSRLARQAQGATSAFNVSGSLTPSGAVADTLTAALAGVGAEGPVELGTRTIRALVEGLKQENRITGRMVTV